MVLTLSPRSYPFEDDSALSIYCIRKQSMFLFDSNCVALYIVN